MVFCGFCENVLMLFDILVLMLEVPFYIFFTPATYPGPAQPPAHLQAQAKPASQPSPATQQPSARRKLTASSTARLASAVWPPSLGPQPS